MYFLIKDDHTFEKFSTIRDKVSADIEKDFGSESDFNKYFLKTKTEPHGDEVTGFYDKKMIPWILIILV